MGWHRCYAVCARGESELHCFRGQCAEGVNSCRAICAVERPFRGLIDVATPLAAHPPGHLATLVAVVTALTAGASFALASVWQQRAAASAPMELALAPRLLLLLARQPLWLAGLGAGMASFGLQVLALAFGPLTLVQPLIVQPQVRSHPRCSAR